MKAKLTFTQLAEIMSCIKQYKKSINEEIPQEYTDIYEEILNIPEYDFYLIDRTSYENLQHLSNK